MRSSFSCFSSDCLPILKFLSQRVFARKPIKTTMKAATFAVVVVTIIHLIISLKFINVPSVFKHFGSHFCIFPGWCFFSGGEGKEGVAPCFHDEAFEKMKPEKAKRQVESRCRQLFICLWLLLTRAIS